MNPCSIFSVLKQINAVEVVIISMIHMLNKLCVPDVVKNINEKVFNLMSWSNQTKHIEWHETCRLDGMKME